MLEKNKAYNFKDYKIVYLEEDSAWKKEKGIEDLIFTTPSKESEQCMLQILISKKDVKNDGKKLILDRKGSFGTLYIYKNKMPEEYKELKNIYDNAIKDLEQKTN